jgi:hypothetical protein
MILASIVGGKRRRAEASRRAQIKFSANARGRPRAHIHSPTLPTTQVDHFLSCTTVKTLFLFGLPAMVTVIFPVRTPPVSLAFTV